MIKEKALQAFYESVGNNVGTLIRKPEYRAVTTLEGS